MLCLYTLSLWLNLVQSCQVLGLLQWGCDHYFSLGILVITKMSLMNLGFLNVTIVSLLVSGVVAIFLIGILPLICVVINIRGVYSFLMVGDLGVTPLNF